MEIVRIVLIVVILGWGDVWGCEEVGGGAMRCSSVEEVYDVYSAHVDGDEARMYIDILMTRSEMRNIAMVVNLW